jgi:hypothetical protein
MEPPPPPDGSGVAVVNFVPYAKMGWKFWPNTAADNTVPQNINQSLHTVRVEGQELCLAETSQTIFIHLLTLEIIALEWSVRTFPNCLVKKQRSNSPCTYTSPGTNFQWMYKAHPVSKVPWGRLQKQNTISWKTKLNSMVWVRERTIPTERPPLVGEVIANFCG